MYVPQASVKKCVHFIVHIRILADNQIEWLLLSEQIRDKCPAQGHFDRMRCC